MPLLTLLSATWAARGARPPAAAGFVGGVIGRI